MNLRWRRPSLPAVTVWLALFPALMVFIASVIYNRFTLVDDGMVLEVSTRHAFSDLLTPTGAGRFFPAYWIYHWLMFHLLPAQAWVPALANGMLLLLTVALVYLLARRMAGPWAGVAAGWLLCLNFATAETLFTLSKSEIKQAPLLLGVILLLDDLLAGRRAPTWKLFLALPALAVLATLFKETGILLAVPLVIALLSPTGPPGKSVRGPMVATLVSLALCIPPIFIWGMKAGGYARATVFHEYSPSRGFDRALLLVPNAQLALLLLAGLAGAMWLWRVNDAARRRLPLLCGVCMALFGGLYLRTRLAHPYYFFPAVCFAAPLMATGGAALWQAANRGRRVVIASGFSLLLLWGAQNLLLGASLLSGWGWLCESLRARVLVARPAAIWFDPVLGHDPVTGALLLWQGADRVSTTIGVYDGARPPAEGDWYLSFRGPAANARVPFRGVALALPEPPAPQLPTGCTLAPLREFRISQPGFSRWPLWVDADRIGLTYRLEQFTGAGCGNSAP